MTLFFHSPRGTKGGFLCGLCVPSTLLRTCFAGDIPSFGCGCAALSTPRLCGEYSFLPALFVLLRRFHIAKHGKDPKIVDNFQSTGQQEGQSPRRLREDCPCEKRRQRGAGIAG